MGLIIPSIVTQGDIYKLAAKRTGTAGSIMIHITEYTDCPRIHSFGIRGQLLFFVIPLDNVTHAGHIRELPAVHCG